MAYDDHSGGALLFGGQFFSSARLADTWQWDGQNWTQMNDIGPPARSDSAMAYDSQRKRTVLFGGTSGSTLFGDTWEWDGEDWTEVANDGPTRRSQHSLVYDSSRHLILLFGGIAVGSHASNDTWTWDGDAWVQVEDTGPPKRYSAAMAFDANRGRAVLFGGTNGKNVFDDTWEWDGSSWSEVSTIGPPACFAGTMIYTGDNARLYGGMSSQSSKATLSGNSWEWDGKHWTLRQDIGPGGRWGHAMAFDSNRSRGVFFGGCALPLGPSKSKALGDTWEQFEEGVAVNPTSNTSTTSSQSVTSTQPATSTNTPSTASASGTPAQVDPSAVSSTPAPQHVYYDPTITSVTVSPTVVREGTPVALYYRVSPPPPFDPNVVVIQVSKLVRLSISRAADNGSFKLLDFQHEWYFQPPYPLVLPAGYYSISGELGGTIATTALTVQGGFPSPTSPLPSLYSGSPPSFNLSGPSTVAAGTPFTLSVNLGSPVFTDTYIPLIVTVWAASIVQWSGLVFSISTTSDGDPDMVWFGQPSNMQLRISAGASSGQVQIYAPSITGGYTWRAIIWGSFSNSVDLLVT
jgi:hypothetical protein